MNPIERVKCMHRIIIGLTGILLRTNSDEDIKAINAMIPYMKKLHKDLVDDEVQWIQRKKETDSD